MWNQTSSGRLVDERGNGLDVGDVEVSGGLEKLFNWKVKSVEDLRLVVDLNDVDRGEWEVDESDPAAEEYSLCLEIKLCRWLSQTIHLRHQL